MPSGPATFAGSLRPAQSLLCLPCRSKACVNRRTVSSNAQLCPPGFVQHLIVTQPFLYFDAIQLHQGRERHQHERNQKTPFSQQTFLYSSKCIDLQPGPAGGKNASTKNCQKPAKNPLMQIIHRFRKIPTWLRCGACRQKWSPQRLCISKSCSWRQLLI